jgi:hypothetical protein
VPIAAHPGRIDARARRHSVTVMSTAETDDHKHGTGAEGDGSTDASVPFEPSKDDDSPLGSTDQHSKVSHDGPTPEEDAARQTDNVSAD